MNEDRFRVVLGFSVVAAHLILIALCLGLFLAGGFHFEELTTLVAILLPITATYTSAAVGYFAKMRAEDTQDSSRIRPRSLILLTSALGITFFCSVAALLVLKALNLGPLSFEMLKTLLAGSEVAVGIYFSRLFFSFFERA